MNRRNFLTFLGLGTIGAALSIEPSYPTEPAVEAIARRPDIAALEGKVLPVPYENEDTTRVVFYSPHPMGWMEVSR